MATKAFGKRDLQHIDKIKLSGSNTNMVQIKYRDKKGNVSIRYVEPYKMDGEDFWGYDPDKGGIRRFKIRNVRSVNPTNKLYDPRWAVEMDKTSRFYEEEIYKMASISVMNFPRSEHASLKQRLETGQPTYTTRVSKETGKYLPGKIYQTNLGLNVVIEKKESFDNIDDHPFLSELNKKQISDLKKYNEGMVELIKFKKAAKGEEEIYKAAAIKEDVKLYPHQQKSVDRPGDSVIYAHGVGSGKTLTGIARFEKLKASGKATKALVVVPASLRENFAVKGVGKFTNSKANIVGNKSEISSGLYNQLDPNADYNVISYEMFRSNPEKFLKESGADTVITDESHRGKNEYTQTTKALKDTRGLYKNYIGLTGSVISNEIADVLPLVDVASNGKHNLGKNKEEFSKRYLKRSDDKKYQGMNAKRIPAVGFNRQKELEKTLSKYVDYLDNDDIKDVAKMPNKNVDLVKVPISKEQARMYKDLLEDNDQVRKMITTKRLETFKDDEIAKAFSTMVEARKLMNSVGSVHPDISLKDSSKITPKTKKLLDDLQKHLEETPDGQALLFSNLINGGTDVLEAGLDDRHIPYGRFIGKGNKGVTEQGRQQDVTDYNKRKKRVMVISGAGGEGISLDDTTWEGVLDPHYNPEKMKQMEARGVRSGGLSHRQPQDRTVDVNRYMATMPKTFGIFKSRYRTPDEFIYEVANHKDKQNQLLFNLMKKDKGDKGMNKTSEFYEQEIYKEAKMSQFQVFKKNQVNLSKEEQAIVKERKAVWTDGSSAVWKSTDPKSGKTTYITHTHRAYNTAPTLKGAIGRFHSFIKSTAKERGDSIEKIAEEEKPNIVFDFDGVIHSYKSGWKGNNVIPDEPVRGINEAIQDLRKDHKIIVVSTRCASPGGIDAIKKYLEENDIEVDDVTDKKPPAIAYVDDNGVNFDGDASSLPAKVRDFKSWLKKASEYEDAIYKEAEEQFMYHASRVQDIKKFRKSEDTSGNNKGQVIFVSKDPSFAAAFGAKWNDGDARFVVETSNKDVPDEDNYKGTRLEYTDGVNLDKPCSMYKLKGNFKPLRYDNDIEHYTDKDVDIVSEEQFKTFRDMANHYGVTLKKVTEGHISEQLKCKKSSNFEKKSSEYEMEIYKTAADNENMVGKDGKIPAIEKALDDPIARKVATMMATSHEYKTPNVDGALAMVKNYKWEEDTAKLNSLQGINKPVDPEKALTIAMSIKKSNRIDPFIVVNQLHGIRPQSSGKKILLDGHHRQEACEILKKEEVPVYKGTYTGEAQRSKDELRSK